MLWFSWLWHWLLIATHTTLAMHAVRRPVQVAVAQGMRAVSTGRFPMSPRPLIWLSTGPAVTSSSAKNNVFSSATQSYAITRREFSADRRRSQSSLVAAASRSSAPSSAPPPKPRTRTKKPEPARRFLWIFPVPWGSPSTLRSSSPKKRKEFPSQTKTLHAVQRTDEPQEILRPAWFDPRKLLHILWKPRVDPVLRIGAYNVKSFGLKKAQSIVHLMLLAEIITHFDVISLLEIRDSTGGNQAVQTLLDAIRTYCEGLRRDGKAGMRRVEECDYDVVMSPCLGRAVYKEQVAVFYRRNRVKPVKSFVASYDDQENESSNGFWNWLTGGSSLISSNDFSSGSSKVASAKTPRRRSPSSSTTGTTTTTTTTTSSSGSETDLEENIGARRPPFVTIFEQMQTGKKVMVLSVHLSPFDVVSEMDLLARSYKELRRQFGRKVDAKLIIGDLNADGKYLSGRTLFQTELFRDDKTFYWPQPYARAVFGHAPLGSTTTYATRDHMYDRVILGKEDQHKMIPDSGRVYRWPDWLDWKQVQWRWQLGGGATTYERPYRKEQQEWKLASLLSDHLPVEVRIDLTRET